VTRSLKAILNRIILVASGTTAAHLGVLRMAVQTRWHVNLADVSPLIDAYRTRIEQLESPLAGLWIKRLL
jgi:hypothetical protein